MSAKVKKAGRIGTKIVAVFLFVFLVMFNVQIGMNVGESGDISLWGLTLSLFAPSYAGTVGGGGAAGTCCPGGPGTCVINDYREYFAYYVSDGPCPE